MKTVLPLLFLLVTVLPCASQQTPVHWPDVTTTWPGIHYQVFHVDRIPNNRLAIGIQIYAAPGAPQEGTFIGVGGAIPDNADPRMVAAGMYQPTAFSIKSAILTDDATKRRYQTVVPDPAGPNYYPATMMATLHPLQAHMMTIEFPCPPPPPPNSDGTAPKQTVSILLPNAKGPLTHIPLPPLVTPAPSP